MILKLREPFAPQSTGQAKPGANQGPGGNITVAEDAIRSMP